MRDQEEEERGTHGRDKAKGALLPFFFPSFLLFSVQELPPPRLLLPNVRLLTSGAWAAADVVAAAGGGGGNDLF